MWEGRYKIHYLSNSALDWGEMWTSHAGRFPPRDRALDWKLTRKSFHELSYKITRINEKDLFKKKLKYTNPQNVVHKGWLMSTKGLKNIYVIYFCS